MWSVNGNNITLSRGDTFAVTFHSGKTDWADEDRAVFTIKDASGTVMFSRAYELDENGDFTVNFSNSTTDTWSAGAYTYDVRYVITPVYDENGTIINGASVITPIDPSTFTIKTTVGDV